jgi:hypothetical protein
MKGWMVWPVLLVGILTGAAQAKELIAPWYVMARAAVIAGFEIVDLNLDRQTPPMEGLNRDE